MAFRPFGKNIGVRQAQELYHNIGLVSIEDDTGTYTYKGKAVSGTATSASSWWIKRITNADNKVENAVLPSGKEDNIFSNEWDERANLNYS